MLQKLFSIIFCVFLVSGCASTHMITPDREPVITPKTEKSTLLIIRDTYFGGAIVFSNYVDGKFIGETKGNTYIMSEVEPGPHYVVAATENTATAHIDFEPNKIYFLRQGIAMGVWRARTSGFSPIPPEEALKSMKDCTYLEYDPDTNAPDMDPEHYKTAIDEYEADVKENPDGYKDMLEYEGVDAGSI